MASGPEEPESDRTAGSRNLKGREASRGRRREPPELAGGPGKGLDWTGTFHDEPDWIGLAGALMTGCSPACHATEFDTWSVADHIVIRIGQQRLTERIR